MKKKFFLVLFLSAIPFLHLHAGDVPAVRVLAGTNEFPSGLFIWMAEDLAGSGLPVAGYHSETNPSFFKSSAVTADWTVRQEASDTGGVLRYYAELSRRDWTMSVYDVFIAGTNDLRAAVRTAAARFSRFIQEYSPVTNSVDMADTNLIDENTKHSSVNVPSEKNTESAALPAKPPTLSPTKPADKRDKIGVLIALEGGMNLSADTNGGVTYLSGGVSIQKNLFGGLYLGWKTAYDHYTISQTNAYAYRLDTWKNTMVLNYQFYFPFPVFLEAGVGLGGYFGQIDYASSATNFTCSVLGAVVEPKIGAGLYFGDWLVSFDAVFNYCIFYFNSINYPLMGLVAGASVGWKF